MGHLSYNPMVANAGEAVQSCAKNMEQIGEAMYSHLRGLIGGEQLSGEGIARALDESQARWDAACREFAAAEQEFGTRTISAYDNMMAADRRGGSYF